MAKNIKRNTGKQLSVTVTHPTTPASGDPVRWGDRCGVALTDERTDGTTSVQFSGTAMLSVKGVAAGGNAAIAEGDSLFYVDADTPKLSAKVAGKFFGYAMAAVGSGSTTTIEVRIGY